MENVLYIPKLQKQISSLRYKHDKVVDLIFKLFDNPDNLSVIMNIRNNKPSKNSEAKSLDEEIQESIYNKLIDQFFYILVEKSPYSYIQQQIIEIKRNSDLGVKLGILDHFLCSLNGGVTHLNLEQRIGIFTGYLNGLSCYSIKDLLAVDDDGVRKKLHKYGLKSKYRVGRPRISVSQEQIRSIVEQYFNQISLEDIEQNIGLERQKISEIIKELKLPSRLKKHRITKEFEKSKEEYFNKFNILKTSLETYL